MTETEIEYIVLSATLSNWHEIIKSLATSAATPHTQTHAVSERQTGLDFTMGRDYHRLHYVESNDISVSVKFQNACIATLVYYHDDKTLAWLLT